MHSLSSDQALELLHHTEALADVGGWEVNTESGHVHWTKGTQRIFGVEGTFDVEVEDALSYIHPNDRAMLIDCLEASLEGGEPCDVTLRIVTAQDRLRWARVTGEPANGRPAMRGAIKDVTEQKRTGQQLMVLNRVLRHNISNDLTAILGHAELLEQSVRHFKADKRANASGDTPPGNSHDTDETLREALAMFDTNEGIDPSTVYDSALAIRRNARDIANISEKVREVERQVEANTTLQAVQIDPILSNLIDRFDRAHPNAELSYDGRACAIRGNAYGFERAIKELCENAIKHNDRPAPTVSISVNTGERSIEIQIADDGPGIPAMERETLQSGEETPLHHGSGIGLWLVNWLVGQQDGEITLSGREPHGTSVDLTFARADLE